MDNRTDGIYVDGVLFTKDMKTLLLYPEDKRDKVYRVPDGVLVIGEDAFENVHLETIVFPASLKAIIQYAFYCKNLAFIYIPRSLSKIYLKAFYCCSSIKRVYYEGSEQEWNNIDFTYSNDSLTNSEIIFDCEYLSQFPDNSNK